MEPELEKRLVDLVLRALDRPSAERRPFLEKACAGDPDLLAEALEVLAQEQDLGDFLEQSPLPALTPTEMAASPEFASRRSPELGPEVEEAAEEVLRPDDELGHYRVLARLGAGGMGEVYRALDLELEREVALKVLHPDLTRKADAMQRFRREARLLASVNHPNIATIHGVGEERGIRFLVMELVAGETLATRVEAGALPRTEALDFALQIARALEAAHRKGVIHRDLKPANVMVDPEGRVKVLDFGLAKALGAGAVADLTQLAPSAPSVLPTDVSITAGLMGTIAYMSPEQVRREPVDLRSDIWAFGCVSFELLSGRRPFWGASGIETMSAILEREPAWEVLPELPPGVRSLLERCLRKKPGERPQSMGRARRDLEEVVAGLSSLAGAPTVSLPGGAPPGLPEAGSATLAYLEQLGAYTVVERIAAGGQGEVYRVWDREHKRGAALKVLRPKLLADPEAREGLRREAQALSWLRHPNIAHLYSHGSAEGVDYLVTEFVHGSSLAARVADGPLPEAAVARIGAQIAAALAAAHEHGILHGDLKAGNVMITPDGEAKVIDFGLARIGPADEAEEDVAAGASRAGYGPLSYRPPEVLRGERAEAGSDLYQLGVVLYQMATGRRPFEGEGGRLEEEVLSRPSRPPRELAPSLGADLEGLILRCLEKEPERRPASAAELAAELAALAPSGPLSALSPPSSPSLSLPPAAPESPPAAGAATGRRRPALALAAAAVLVLAALLGSWLWRRGEVTALDGIDSLVVMPSRLRGEESAPYLADALAETLSGVLSRLEDLETRLPPSSLEVDRSGGDLARIAAAYGVGAVVLSTLDLQQREQVFEVQLVEAKSRNLLWSERYREPGEAEPAAALRLARRAGEELRRALGPATAAAATAAAGNRPEVDRLLQQGRYHSNLFRNLGREGDKQRALAAFEEAFETAEEREPGKARAAGEIAVLHASSLDLGISILELVPEIRSWAERALELDPRASKAWAALSFVEAGRQQESYRRQLEYLLKAATYDPSDAWAVNRLSGALARLSFSLALASSRQAVAIEPLVLTPRIFEAICLGPVGERQEALGAIDRALEIEPGMPFGLMVRGLTLALIEGREEEALALVAERLEPLAEQGQLHPSWVALARDLATFALATRSGDAAAADAAAGRLVAASKGEAPFPRWEMATTEVAGQLSRLGRREEAVEILRARSAQGIFEPYDYLLFSRPLAPIRDDPSFRELLTEAKGRFEGILGILEEARAKGEMPAYLEAPLADLLKRIRAAQQGRVA